jgi:hypothetical protein
MTVVEHCSLSPRSHPPLDSVSGQPWPAITVPLSGIYSPGRTKTPAPDRIGGNLDFGAVSPPARWRRKRGVCGLFDECRAAASDSTGDYQCSRRTDAHDIPSPGRHCRPPAAARCVNRARLGPARVPLVREVCPANHPFPGWSRHAATFHRQRVQFRPDNWLRCDILTPRGSVDRQLARCAVHWRMQARPFAAEIWGSAGYKNGPV